MSSLHKLGLAYSNECWSKYEKTASCIKRGGPLPRVPKIIAGRASRVFCRLKSLEYTFERTFTPNSQEFELSSAG